MRKTKNAQVITLNGISDNLRQFWTVKLRYDHDKPATHTDLDK